MMTVFQNTDGIDNLKSSLYFIHNSERPGRDLKFTIVGKRLVTHLHSEDDISDSHNLFAIFCFSGNLSAAHRTASCVKIVDQCKNMMFSTK